MINIESYFLTFKLNTFHISLQSHVHGHAWCAEDEQPYHDQYHAGSIQRGSEDSWRVSDTDQGQLVSHCSFITMSSWHESPAKRFRT